MDEKIKRALVITVAVVVVARLASMLLDGFLDDTQDEMIANQQAFSNHVKGIDPNRVAATQSSDMEQNCAPVLRSESCMHPKRMSQIQRCFERLRHTGCFNLPDVNLCHAVNEIEACNDPFLDPAETRCDRLRAMANCEARPIPETWQEREELWTIELVDGEWAALDE